MDTTVRPATGGWVPALLPLNEAERLEQLRHFCILDTTKDLRFDRITRLTAEILDVPIVLLSLVDEAREWFKSAVGTEVAEIRREHGFCAHAILLEGTQPMVVTDTALDPRFATHPFVVGEPKLRFYAGAPLVTAGGFKLGMLCLHDTNPRPDFGPQSLHVLSQFAAIAMDEIDFHRIECERRLLLSELSHRMKNVFSVVQSVAAMSSRDDPAAERYAKAFSSRLGAMSAAHDQLLKANWKQTGLRSLTSSVVAACQDLDANRISIDMPDSLLDPAFAQTLALLVNELMTNALKYGALKHPVGLVRFSALPVLAANADGTGKPSGLKFQWVETGGETPLPPKSAGFGQRMITMAVRQRGGTVSFDWRASGLVCEFEMFDLNS